MHGNPLTSEQMKIAFEAMGRQAGGNARKLAAVSAAAAENNFQDLAYSLAIEAQALAPQDPEIASLIAGSLASGVPSWHFKIVRDDVRNAVYRAALERTVGPNDRVLDIGIGTGLLSMMAARAGAADVIGCEMNPPVADHARRVVAQNGYADRIRVVSKHSDALDIEADMGGQVDVIVSEIVSNDLLGEQVLPVMADVVPRLLKPGGRVIPSRGMHRVALAHWDGLDDLRLGMTDGFDLSPFNPLLKFPQRLRVGDARLHLRSPPADLFTFDFASGGPYRPGNARLAMTATGGPANGVAQWIRFDLDDTLSYENMPAPGTASCWACLFYPLAATAAEGAALTVRGTHNTTRVRVWAEPA